MKGILTLYFDSYWHVGTGDMGGADLDAFFDRDAEELPWLRGRRLKGLLKDAARLHERFDQTPNQGVPLAVDAAFGMDGGGDNSPAGVLDIRSAVLNETDRRQLLARKAEFSALSETLSGTAMLLTGVAEGKSLRRIEAAIPMTLQAIIEWPDAIQGADTIYDWLAKVVRLLRYAGRHRHRGLGRCRAKLNVCDEATTDAEEESSDASRREDLPQCLTLRLTFKDAVVLSARAASAGPHETLDYIPGSVLWGAASPLYGQWAKNGEWEKVQSVFHSGRIRFLPGHPADEFGKLLLPTPLAWHFKKGAKFHADDRLVGDEGTKLKSLSTGEWNLDADSQPQQVRGGWFSPEGAYKTVQREYQAKTAVNPQDFDRAEDSQFFGYSAIAPGQTFIARIEAEINTPGWDDVVKFFRGKSELRLGRSKSAEYGRATVEIVADSAWSEPGASPSASADKILLHALSDIALVDEHGQPTLTSEPGAFGLFEAWVPDPDHTYIQVRSYSPWNRHRGVHDAERQVIKAGSVLAFKRVGPHPLAPLDVTRLSRRVGVWREQGLGMVAINPAYLFKVPIIESVLNVGTSASDAGSTVVTALPLNASPLAKAMHRRYCQRTVQRLAVALGREWAQRWQAGRVCAGLSKSQWARLREAAITATSLDELILLLDGDASGLFKHGLSAGKWGKADEPRTPAKRVLAALKGEAAVTVLETELAEAGMPNVGENLSTLALHACREAAIACARAK